MLSLLKVFFTGLAISFLGSLPLGSLNISAMQVALQENVRRAIFFSLGVALVEIIYVRISLTGMDWVIRHRQLFHILEWATVFLFIALAVSSFIAANKKTGAQKNILLNNKLNRFWLGVTMSAINPVQIPFWFIWSTYLLSTKVLLPVTSDFTVYTIGIGIGTLLALGLFVFGGRILVQKLNASHRIINLAVALVFLISAIVQLYRVLNKPFGSAIIQ
jgi:threonine/homoserine/homoserine lactone efflux protein